LENSKLPNGNNPYATVVICTMGEPKRVLECLNAQTFRDFEVIVASEKGIVNALNLALGRARGEITIRIDDDVYLPPRWLEELIKPFSDPCVAGATGPTFVPRELRQHRDSIRIWENPNRFLKWMTKTNFRPPYSNELAPAAIYDCGMVSYDSNYEERFYEIKTMPCFQCDHLEGTNWAMRTKLIREVGGFNPAFDGVCEWFDTDVEFKIKKLGYVLRYCPKAYLWHLLEFSPNYNERFDGVGRIKNWIRFHRRHSKFHWKMVVYLMVWGGYFITRRFKKLFFQY